MKAKPIWVVYWWWIYADGKRDHTKFDASTTKSAAESSRLRICEMGRKYGTATQSQFVSEVTKYVAMGTA